MTLIKNAEFASEQDYERRFGGVARLYGAQFLKKLEQSHFVVVGLGGVGSWVVEALARCGVKELSLIDLDHVSISNSNRQIQALDGNFGASKVQVCSIRSRLINPSIKTNEIEDWIDETNLHAIFSSLPAPIDAIFDCTDQVRAKAALVSYSYHHQIPLILSGATGGKRSPQQLQVKSLSLTTHDPLLAKVRAYIRKNYTEIDLNNAQLIKAVFSTEPVKYPTQDSAACNTGFEIDRQGLNCGGFGSSLLVTGSAAFLMVHALFDEWYKNVVIR